MNEYEAVVKFNPIDDIKYKLDWLSNYNPDVEIMKANGTYEAFVKKVYDTIDWPHLLACMTKTKDDYITKAIDAVMLFGDEDCEDGEDF